MSDQVVEWTEKNLVFRHQPLGFWQAMVSCALMFFLTLVLVVGASALFALWSLVFAKQPASQVFAPLFGWPLWNKPLGFSVFVAMVFLIAALVLPQTESNEFNLDKQQLILKTRNVWGLTKTTVLAFEKIRSLEVQEIDESPTEDWALRFCIAVEESKIRHHVQFEGVTAEEINAWVEWLRPHLGNRIKNGQAS